MKISFTRDLFLIFRYNKYSIHCLAPEPSYILLCITHEKYQAALAFQYLTELFALYKFELDSDYNNYKSGLFVPFKCKYDLVITSFFFSY